MLASAALYLLTTRAFGPTLALIGSRQLPRQRSRKLAQLEGETMPLPQQELTLARKRTNALLTWITPDGAVRRAAPTPALLSERLYEARQARDKKWKVPNEKTHQGFYWMSQTGQLVWHETMLEYLALMYLDFADDIAAIVAQPMLITFGDGTAHFPDFMCLTKRAEQAIVDVHRADKIEEDPSQFEKTFDLCQCVGWTFRLFAGLNGVQVSNLEWLSRFRHRSYVPTLENRDEILGFAGRGATLGEVANRHPGSQSPLLGQLYNMIWRREIGFDLSEPMSTDSPLWRLQ
ncbi:TnsA-like heteromeric transposase endonuclease subunit [Curtobacterium sp. MCPF17_018]|uniref:TnsA-like heteromeric transposase endonuclease subunit n=1 Tax=Curtobacterium sp. MCPF17_018 TaxID=2175638 RepID=UPI0015E8CC05|nr:TnsA-like heteromeric transposase endonuclease subunit [Curtobacterium sp. MCPF17_018]